MREKTMEIIKELTKKLGLERGQVGYLYIEDSFKQLEKELLELKNKKETR